MKKAPEKSFFILLTGKYHSPGMGPDKIKAIQYRRAANHKIPSLTSKPELMRFIV